MGRRRRGDQPRDRDRLPDRDNHQDQEETPQDRQNNEFTALQAIFCDDLKDLRSESNQEEWQPLELLLSLFPQQGSSANHEVHCSATLHIKCSENYPEVEPIVNVKDVKGLSDSLVQVLLGELNDLAFSHKGEVMIFELAQHVQTYLHKHNKPAFKSFYEEMLSGKNILEQNKLRDKQVKEDRERQKIKDEVLKRQEILRSEHKFRKEARHSISAEIGNENSVVPSSIVNPTFERIRTYSNRRRNQSISESSDGSIYCEHRGIKTIDFCFKGERQISRGKCIGHSERGCVVYAGSDMSTGEMYAVTEWSIKLHDQRGSPQIQNTARKKENSPIHCPVQSYELSYYLKQMASIEQELSYLMKLHHDNLVHYVNLKYFNDENVFTVYLLQEFVFGGNLMSLYLNNNIAMEVDMLHHVAFGLLNAIDYLHRNNVVHKSLREASIFIDQNGAVRLADYSLDWRLMDMCQLGHTGLKCHKKQDIYKIGKVFLSLVKGTIVEEENPQIPNSLPQDLKDFLNNCLDPNERTRWSADQLLNHQFIKTPIEKISPQRTIDHDRLNGSSGSHDDCEEAPDVRLFIPDGISGQSRIKNEFEILKWLGKGAFGDVLKVRNILDGRSYALKRIELNPKNKQLNKKITREVKLLSRLHHENVVRYYNSWIECGVLENRNDDTEESNTTIDEPQKPANKRIVKFSNNKDVEKFAPSIKSMEWSVSYASRSKKPNQNDSEDSSSGVDTSEDDDDDDDVLIDFKNAKKDSGSDSIEFQGEDSKPLESSSSVDQSENKVNGSSSSGNVTQVQFLYIQMEFCEKSTLRNAIDNGLHLDQDRMWRLFREIVEGLSHIHQQGMIHRDLKPVNIFLDSNDHVKIGDFGLATNILRGSTQLVVEVKGPSEIDAYAQEITGDGSLTGHVGTALYVAPELTMAGNKAIYNQKVDIYSLGIIAFEMSHSPLKTGMERVKILGNLRTKDIIFPEAFNVPENSKQTQLIKWLLNHDPSGRPTCVEILQWNQLPGALEEYELKDVLRHAFVDRHSKAYKHLINTCFQQEFPPADNITYDMTILRPNNYHAGNHYIQNILLTTYVKEIILKIFKLHCGFEIATPLLLPRTKLYDTVDLNVRVMTHSGEIVHIPHDLRVPFARYIVWNGITMMKRYCIDRVYREKKILSSFSFHPRELYECSFDIVTPTAGNLMAETELLSIFCEIAKEFPTLKNKNLTLKLNHTSLLKAVLLNSGIEPEKYTDIYSILADARDGRLSKFQVQTHLVSLCLSDQSMATLFALMATECPIDKIGHILKASIKRKGEVSILAKEGLKDLETIVNNAEAIGVKCPILICPCLVYNVHQYSGMMCQFVCEMKKKRRKGAMHVIAAGGRYDNLLSVFRKKLQNAGMEHCKSETTQAAAGISISLERLVQCVSENSDEVTALDVSMTDICVCSTSTSKQATKEKAQIVSNLWAAGIQANLIEATNMDEIEEICRGLTATHNIVVKDSEQGTAWVRSWDRDRFQERKVPIPEIVDFMTKLLKSWNSDGDNFYNSVSSSSSVQRSESRTMSSDFEKPSSNAPITSFNFMTPEKLSANTRKRYEIQITSQMSSILQKLSSKSKVEVLAISLNASVIRSMVMHLEMDAPQHSHDKAVKSIIEKHSKYKKDIMAICDEFRDLSLEKIKPVIVFYSITDSYFKVVM